MRSSVFASDRPAEILSGRYFLAFNPLGWSMLISIASVVGGYVAMAITVMVGTAAAVAAVVPGGLKGVKAAMEGNVERPLPHGYLGINLALSFLAALVGGWLTALLAPSSQLGHVAALAALTLLMGVVAARTQTGGGGRPTWYSPAITASGIAGVFVGGLLKIQIS